MKLYGYDWISLPLVYTQVLLICCAGFNSFHLVINVLMTVS